MAPNSSQLKNLTDLMTRITVQYKCPLNFSQLQSIVRILRCNADHTLRNNTTLADLIRSFKFNPGINHNALFHACAYQILAWWQNNLLNEDEAFTELYRLASELKVDYFEPKLLTSLYKNCQTLKSTGPFQIQTNPVVQTLVQMNQKAADVHTNKRLASLNDLVYKHFVKLHPDQRHEIAEYFGNNSILFEVSEGGNRFGPRTIEAERSLFKELKSKGKDVNPVLRRLVILACKEAYRHKGLVNAAEKVEEFLKQLPESEMTPLVCHELIRFHVLVTRDIQQATSWYEKLGTKLNGSDFEMSKETTLLYANELLLQKQNQQPNISMALKIFETNRWRKNECDESLNRLLLKLLRRASSLSNGQEFLQLSEAIFKSSFSPRNTLITRMVMFKFIKSNDFYAAFDYYKLNLQMYDQSILELLLIRHYMSAQAVQVEANIKKFEELLAIMAGKFNWNFLFNSMFWAEIMNKNYAAADRIFVNDLKRKLDMSVLRRACNQSTDNKDLEHVMKSLFNVFNSALFQRSVADFEGKRQLRAEIEAILKEGNGGKKPAKKL